MLTQTTPFRRTRTAGKVQGAGRSLSLRRTWYAEDPGKLDADAGDKKADGDDGDADSEDDDSLVKLSPKELAEIVRRERRDAANYRTRLRETEAVQKKADEEKAKAARLEQQASAKKLEEQGEFKTLYEQQQEALKTLEEKAKRADAYEQKLQAKNEVRVKAIPPSHVSLVPKGYNADQLEEWLDANEPLWKATEPPNFDPGKKGDRKVKPDAKSTLGNVKF